MLIQQAIHIFESIPLYHSTRHSNSQILVKKMIEHMFYILPQKLLNKLSPNSIDIHCKPSYDICHFAF
jgi:hypothetical protein